MGTVEIILRIRPGKREEFLQTIRSIQNNLKEEEDLVKAALYQNMNDSLAFHLIEDWRSQDSMEQYIRSERFGVLMGALKVLCSQSEVKYQISSDSLGRKLAEI